MTLSKRRLGWGGGEWGCSRKSSAKSTLSHISEPSFPSPVPVSSCLGDVPRTQILVTLACRAARPLPAPPPTCSSHLSLGGPPISSLDTSSSLSRRELSKKCIRVCQFSPPKSQLMVVGLDICQTHRTNHNEIPRHVH